MSAFDVQRGEAVFNDVTQVDVQIDPVPVGESFPTVSARSTDATGRFINIRARLLDTNADGFYDTLRLNKDRSDEEDPTWVEWQVVTSQLLTVQSGSFSLTGTTGTTGISTVDLTSAFVINTYQSTTAGPNYFMTEVRFQDSSTLHFERTESLGTITNYFYVVEWDELNVHSGTLTIPEGQTQASDTISAVDRDSTFLLFTNWASDGRLEWTQVAGEIDSDTSVLFEREQGDGEIGLTYFVVSHPDLKVQYGTASLGTNTTTQTVTINTVDTSSSWVPATPHYGNGRAIGTLTDARRNGWHTRQLQDATTLEFKRTLANETLTAKWFVVDFSDIVEPQIETREVTSFIIPVASEAEGTVETLTGALELEEGEPIPEEPVDAENYCPFEATADPEDEWIAAVEIYHEGNLIFDSQTPNPSPTGYRDNTDQIISVAPGMELEICITVDAESSFWDEALSWGHDLENPGVLELAEHLVNQSGAPWTYCYNWTVPDQPGNYIASWWIQYDEFTGPCPEDGTISYGERQDFTLHISGTEGYVDFGFRESPAVDISEVSRVVHSKVIFNTLEPTGTEVKVFLSPDGSTWHEVDSGDSIPFLTAGEESPYDEIYVRQELSTADSSVTPHLYYFQFCISYKRKALETVTSYFTPFASEAAKAAATVRTAASFTGILWGQSRRFVGLEKTLSSFVDAVQSRAAPDRAKRETLTSFFGGIISQARVKVGLAAGSFIAAIGSAARRQAEKKEGITSFVGTIASRARSIAAEFQTVASHIGTVRSEAVRTASSLESTASYMARVQSAARRQVEGFITVTSHIDILKSAARRIATALRTVTSHADPVFSAAHRVAVALIAAASYLGQVVSEARRRAQAHRAATSFTGAVQSAAARAAAAVRSVSSHALTTASRALAFGNGFRRAQSFVEGIISLARRRAEANIAVTSFVDTVQSQAAAVARIIVAVTSYVTGVISQASGSALKREILTSFIQNIDSRATALRCKTERVTSWANSLLSQVRVNVSLTARSSVDKIATGVRTIRSKLFTAASSVGAIFSASARQAARIQALTSHISVIVFDAKRTAVKSVVVTSFINIFTSQITKIITITRAVSSYVSPLAAATRRLVSRFARVSSFVGRIFSRALLPEIARVVTSYVGQIASGASRIAVKKEQVASFMARIASRTTAIIGAVRAAASYVGAVLSAAQKKAVGLRAVTSHAEPILTIARRAGQGVRRPASYMLAVASEVIGLQLRRVGSYVESIASTARRVAAAHRAAASHIAGIQVLIRRVVFGVRRPSSYVQALLSRATALRLRVVISYVARFASRVSRSALITRAVTSYLGRVVSRGRRVAEIVKDITLSAKQRLTVFLKGQDKEDELKGRHDTDIDLKGDP